MKKVRSLVVIAAVTTLIGINGVSAQDGPPTFAPFEIYGCTFGEGNDMDDLMPVVEDWNEWADEAGMDDYSAMLAEPFFHNAQFPYDFLWIGFYVDGTAMGTGLHRWVNQSGDLPEQFGNVVDCPLHMGLAAASLKTGSGEGDGVEDGGNFVVEFSNCTVHEGRTRPEAANAVREWIEYLTENGSDSNHSLLIPGPGEAADTTYSFKWLKGYPSYVSLGRDFEIGVNNGGVGRRADLFGRLMSCDSSRIYNGSWVREAGA